MHGIKKCLNETYSKVFVGKHLFDAFYIQNGMKHGDAYLRFETFTWNKCTKIFSVNVPH
jgi:hypothetical protein